MSTVSEIRDAAYDYAERGWRVFPCTPRGKRPCTPHGLKDATLDADQIGAWWSRWPHANVAIATGPPGPIVVDVDGLAGKASWSTFMAGVDNEPTPWARTGRGWHFFYAGEPNITNRAAWLPDVDLRARGGYVIAPPSIHGSGRVYQWGAGPHERPLQPLPDKVRAALFPRPTVRTNGAVPASRVPRAGSKYAAAALRNELDRVRHAGIGTRNHTLCAAAFSLGQLVGAGVVEHDLVVEALYDAARAAGLGETETLRTIASGVRGGLENPRRR